MSKGIFCSTILAIAINLAFVSNSFSQLFMSVSGKVLVDYPVNLDKTIMYLAESTTNKVYRSEAKSTGEFILRDVPKGIYELYAMPDDLFARKMLNPVSITISEGKNVVGVNIKIDQGGVVQGKAVTSYGSPIRSVTVISEDGSSAETDDKGAFLLKGVRAGNSILKVLSPMLGAKTINIMVEKGKISTIADIVFDISDKSAFKGRVIDDSGEPISGAILTVFGPNNSGGYTISDEYGTFYIGSLSEGAYKVHAAAYQYDLATLDDVSMPNINLSIESPPVS